VYDSLTNRSTHRKQFNIY